MVTNDQLNVIFDVIGTPQEEDSSFVTDAKALEYLKSFLTRPKKDLTKVFPAVKPEGLDPL